jgi:hypothetical protein
LYVVRSGLVSTQRSVSSKPEEWLDRYLDRAGKIKTAQLKFCIQAAVPPCPVG